MSYTALYRKYRPSTFEDVKGQHAIVTSLQNQVKTGRIGHAYLLCGTRGTGKTTVAKIFAKAVNCEAPVEGNPCGLCETCKNIQAATSLNVIEIDAASNNGVDNIRSIREEVAYRPTSGKYKVYIIDEVHMLSTGAFNALLKTLEEPPSYVIFILATTEVHKIPVTILSRCQHYDFRRIGIDTVADRLQELVASEGLDVEEKALRYIAKAADGSMRDALSLLDQCISFYINKTLTYDHVLEVLGAIDTEVFAALLGTLLEGDVISILNVVEEMVMSGRELNQMCIDFVWFLRNVLLLKTSRNEAHQTAETALDLSSEQARLLGELAQQTAAETLLRFIRIMSECAAAMRLSSSKRVLLEVTLIKLVKPEMEANTEALKSQVSKLQQMVETMQAQLAMIEKNGIHMASSAAEGLRSESGDGEAMTQDHATALSNKDLSPAQKALAKALPEDLKQLTTQFAQVRSQAAHLMKQHLKGARLWIDENHQLLLIAPNQLAKEYFEKQDNKEALEALLSAQIQRQVTLQVMDVGGARGLKNTTIDVEKDIDDIIKQAIQFPISEETSVF